MKAETKWYDNHSDKYFEVGNKVLWIGSDEEVEGELVLLENNSFTVKWNDGHEIKYPSTSRDAIKIL